MFGVLAVMDGGGGGGGFIELRVECVLHRQMIDKVSQL